MAREPRLIDELEALYEPDDGFVRWEKGGDRSSHVLAARYAELLLRRDRPGDRRLAAEILHRIFSLQIVEPGQRFGEIPFRGNNDLNFSCFLIPHFYRIATIHRRTLDDATAVALSDTLRRTIVAIERRWDVELFVVHRDNLRYTNIFLLHVQGLLIGAGFFGDERLRTKAESQWTRWFNHVAYYGIDEFLSNVYLPIDREALVGIYELCSATWMKREVTIALDHVHESMYAVHHPTLRLQTSGISRCKQSALISGEYDEVFTPLFWSTSYRPPARVIEEYGNRRFPHRVGGRATEVPFRFRCYQEVDFGVGSFTGGHYFPQNVHLIVAVGRDATHREILTVPGRYTFRSCFTAQRDVDALCVFTRHPNSYARTQRRNSDAWLDSLGNEWPAALGMSAGWDVQIEDAGCIRLQAYDKEVTVLPFEIDDGAVKALSPEIKRSSTQTITRAHEEDLAVLRVFLETTDWYGCAVHIGSSAESHELPDVGYALDGATSIFKWGELRIRLFLQPGGEVSEVYDGDWRTAPLFESAFEAVWSGEWVARVVNA